MAKVGDQMDSVLRSLRDCKLSIEQAREKIEQIAEGARARCAEGGDDWILVEMGAGASRAYTNIIEAHPDQTRCDFDAALDAIKRKLDRF